MAPKMVAFLALFLSSVQALAKLRIIKIQMGDQPGDGMDGGLGGIMLFGGGRFELRICNSQICCSTGHLNTSDDNWQSAEINYFVGSQLNSCQDLVIENATSLIVIHQGSDGGRIKDISLWGSNRQHGSHVFCSFDQKLDHDESGPANCSMQPADEEELRKSCNGSPRFCSLKFNEVTFPGAHNAGTGMNSFTLLNCHYKNQDLTITEMLDFGLRYFDIDAKFMHDQLYTGHGPKKPAEQFLYKIFGSIPDALAEVKNWMADHPGEVVVLNIGELQGDRILGLQKLKEIIGNELQGPCENSVCVNTFWQETDSWPTLQEAIDTNRRIFIIARVENAQELGILLTEPQSVIAEQSLKMGKESASASIIGPGKAVKILSTFTDISIGAECKNIPASIERICHVRAAQKEQVDFIKLAVFGTHGSNSITSCLWSMARKCNMQLHNAVKGCKRATNLQIVNFLQSDFPNYPGSGRKTSVEIAEEENHKNVEILTANQRRST